jgi:UPF0176 protein
MKAKGSPAYGVIHTAFYKFVSLNDLDAVIEHLHVVTANLDGSILVAPEGINGMVAAQPDLIDQFEHALQNDPKFNGAFQGIQFKRSPCVTKPFRKLKIRKKREIVPLGIDGVDATKTGIDLSPQQWRELLADEDLVLLDNRNSFEYKVGRFKNAIDPGVNNFRDFPEYVKAHVDEWKRDGKKVAMYCTGGIRCEKTSAWMLDLGMPVYQLQGGILNYFKEIPDAEKEWEGDCFVFDNRIALDTKLEEAPTTLEDVYNTEGEEWRLARAKRLCGRADEA